jgi:hypothetical protein
LAHPLSDEPLPYRQVMDVGLLSYHEFACSHSTLSWLQTSGLPRDDQGQPMRLQVVEECVGGHNVIVKVWEAQE